MKKYWPVDQIDQSTEDLLVKTDDESFQRFDSVGKICRLAIRRSVQIKTKKLKFTFDKYFDIKKY